jgi:hypothetical protein
MIILFSFDTIPQEDSALVVVLVRRFEGNLKGENSLIKVLLQQALEEEAIHIEGVIIPATIQDIMAEVITQVMDMVREAWFPCNYFKNS